MYVSVLSDSALLWILAFLFTVVLTYAMLVLLLYLLTLCYRPIPSCIRPVTRRWPTKPRRRLIIKVTKDKARPKAQTPISSPADPGGLCAAASYVGGKDHNEDCVYAEDLGPAKLMLVADGVSSSTHGALAAQVVVECLSRRIRTGIRDPRMVYDAAFFKSACEAASRQIEGQIAPGESADTTFVALLEFPEHVVLAYLGDSNAIWTRGNLREAKELVIGHQDTYGRLNGYVGAHGVTGTPTVLHVQKKSHADGAIFVIGSDGALPAKRGMKRLHRLLQSVRQLHDADGAELNRQEVVKLIEEVLISWNPDDNATLGLLITPEAMAYWRRQGKSTNKSDKGVEHGNSNAASTITLAEPA